MIRSKILYFWQPCAFCLQLSWILSDAVVISFSFPCLLCFLAGPCDGRRDTEPGDRIQLGVLP